MRTLLVLALIVSWSQNAAAQDRMALLIANESYSQDLGELTNPGNDVELIARSLRAIGFPDANIRILRDADRTTLLDELDRYAERLGSASSDAVGFFYYSGHGAANPRDQRNYLIPVDVRSPDASLWNGSVPVEEVVRRLSETAPNAAHFVVFDACRNVLRLPTKGGKGFLPTREERGVFIAFSTEPGATASDAGGGSGPYAEALASELKRPGQDHLSLFQNVKERVFSSTGVQVPWERNGLLERIYLAGRATAEQKSAPSPRPSAQACFDHSGVAYCVSSFLPTEGINKYDYSPRSASDDDDRTAWVEGRADAGDQGEGEWILLEWGRDRPLAALMLKNGYPKSDRLYLANSRLARIEVILSNGKRFSFDVSDTPDSQTILLPAPETARWAQIAITAVFPGDKYSDTAVNEIKPVFAQ